MTDWRRGSVSVPKIHDIRSVVQPSAQLCGLILLHRTQFVKARVPRLPKMHLPRERRDTACFSFSESRLCCRSLGSASSWLSRPI